MEPWRRRWLERHTWGEALEWKALAVVVVFLGTYAAVQEGAWWAFPAGVLGGWACVAAGDAYRWSMAGLVRRREDDAGD